MRITFFSTQPYDRKSFEEHNRHYAFNIRFLEVQLNEQTASLAHDTDAVCAFVNDRVSPGSIKQLTEGGVKILALRCAGFNNVDLAAARDYNLRVVRVPAYSPNAVAEHAVAMIMALNRKTHKAYNRIREQNFSLNGLLGFDLFGKTVGVVGTGNIGEVFSRIMLGFGCKVLAYDIHENENLKKAGVTYLPMKDLLSSSHIISLHCPLNESTRYIINGESINMMRQNVMLINTSRGGLIDTKAVVRGLKSGKVGALGIDVYEQEENLFFRDLSDTIIKDDVIARLSSFPNVLITAHQGFFTHEALAQIAETTLANLKAFQQGSELTNEVRLKS
jgi:D-lactate dehydrogenase